MCALSPRVFGAAKGLLIFPAISPDCSVIDQPFQVFSDASAVVHRIYGLNGAMRQLVVNAGLSRLSSGSSILVVRKG